MGQGCEWITAAQAAEIIGCHMLTVYRYCRQGLLKSRKTGKRRKADFWAEDVELVKKLKANEIARKRPSRAKKKKRIEAKCPKCRRIHKTTRAWAGDGMPYFYCSECLKTDEVKHGLSVWQNMATV